MELMTQAQAEELAGQLRAHLPKGWTIHVGPNNEDGSAWYIGIYDGPDMIRSKEGISWAVVSEHALEKHIAYLKQREAARAHRQAYQPVLF